MKPSIWFLIIFVFAHGLHGQSKTGSVNAEFSFSGFQRGEFRYFTKKGVFPEQKQSFFSTVFQPEFIAYRNSDKLTLKFVGFMRLEQHNTHRTHADIRELYLQKTWKNWDFSFGVKNIFWGVTESNHLVDIVNQYDLLEGWTVEEKLGQPMFHASTFVLNGNLEVIITLMNRGMKFPENEGRFRLPFSLDHDNTNFEGGKYNPGLAIRWSTTFSIFDVGLSFYHGNSRLPQFLQSTEQTIRLNYLQLDHLGIELQAVVGPMILKAESIYQKRSNDDVFAFTSGVEYTFGNLFNSGVELGLFAEYSYDERREEQITGLDDDFFIGSRLSINNSKSTELSVGLIKDRRKGTEVYTGNVSSRIAQNWKVNAEFRFYSIINQEDILYAVRQDSFIGISLTYYF